MVTSEHENGWKWLPLKFCCPAARLSLLCIFNVPGLTQRASENEKLLARQANLIVPVNWTAHMSSPELIQTDINL